MKPVATPKIDPSSLFKLDLSSGQLLCVQIANHYRQEILNGAYPDGAHLPTCREAGKTLGVAAQTVNQAFDILADEGLVFRRRSVGTVVNLGGRQEPFARRPRSPRQAALPICQVVRLSSLCEEEVDLFFDYQNGLAEGFDAWHHRFEIAHLRQGQSDLDLLKVLVEEKQARGLVAIGLAADAEDYLIESGFPVVFLNRNYSARGAAGVAPDSAGGYREAWEYADRLGHREVGFFGMGDSSYENRYRQCASGWALAHPRCKLSSRVKAPTGATSEAVWESLVKAYGPWKRNSRARKWPTLFFAQTDVIAAKLLRALREHDIRVPTDVSIIGFNNAHIAKHLDPALTTLAIPRYQMALAASRQLLDLLAKRPGAKCAMQTFPVRLIQRESCGKA